MSRQIIGAKGGSGAQFVTKPDSLRSNDSFEILLGLGSGRWKGLVGGLKNLKVNGVPMENADGTSNFQDVAAIFADGNPLETQLVNFKLGGGGANQPVGTTLANPNTGQPGPWVSGAVSTPNADYIDLRFAVQSLFYQDTKSVRENTATIEIEMRPSNSGTWVNIFVAPQSSNLSYSEDGYDNGDFLGSVVYLGRALFNLNGVGFRASTNPNLQIRGKTNSPYVKELRIAVPKTGSYANVGWEVRARLVEKDTVDNNDIQERRAIVFESIGAVIKEPLGVHDDWRGQVWMQVVGKASDQFNGFPELEGVFDTKICKTPPTSVWDPETRQYTGQTWDGSYEEHFTTDPAWQIKEFVEDPIHGLAGLQPGSTLDKWDALEASKYYSELVPDGRGGTHPRFSLNLTLNEAQDVNDLMAFLAGAVNSYTEDVGDGKWRLKVDKPETPKAIFTEDNIFGEFNYSHTDVDSRFNDWRGTFLNEDLDYEQDTVRVYDQGDIDENGTRFTEIALVGCTNRQEALRRLMFRMRVALNEYKIVRFSTNRFGRYINPLDTVLVADGALNADHLVKSTSRLGSSAGTIATLLRPVRLEVGVNYTIQFMTTEKEVVTRNVTNTAGSRGDVTVINLDSALPANVLPESAVALQAVGLSSNPISYRVISVERSEENEDEYSITASIIDSGKWNAMDNVSEQEIQDQVSSIEIDAPTAPADGMFDVLVYATDFDIKRALQVNWNRPGSLFLDGFRVEYRINDGPYKILAENLKDSVIELENPQDGVYDFKITALDRRGVESNPLVGRYELIGSRDFTAPTHLRGTLAERPASGAYNGYRYTITDAPVPVTTVWENGAWIPETNLVTKGSDIGVEDGATVGMTPTEEAQVAQIQTDIDDLVTTYGSTASAAQSAADAAAARDAAEAASSQAQAAKDEAETAKTAAQSAQAAATTQATNAGNSATAAAGSATTASSKADEAAGSASAASGSATAAQTSAANASTSAGQAAQSKTDADSSAASAASSASTAATSATNANNSASAASTSANTAGTHATDAAQSASAASTSANTAATKAGEASTSASQAATSATNASGFASSAQSSAQVSASYNSNGLNRNPDFNQGSVGWFGSYASEQGPGISGGSLLASANGRTNVWSGTGYFYMYGNLVPIEGDEKLELSIGIYVQNTSSVYYIGLVPIDAAGNSLLPGSGNYFLLSGTGGVQPGWNDFKAVLDIGANYPTARYVQIIALFDYPAPTATGGITQVDYLRLRDVTESVNSAASASAAATSASAASVSANDAGQFASSASASATTATTKAGEASTSATNASSSATTAGGHATNASNSATAAANSATAAGDSASAASTSASTAGTHATNAGISASAASGHADTATIKAGEASSSATSAASSAAVATDKAAAASTSATVSARVNTGSINPNPNFIDWPTGQSLPSMWSVWGDNGVSRVAQSGAHDVVRMVSSADLQYMGMVEYYSTPIQSLQLLGPGEYVLELEARPISGNSWTGTALGAWCHDINGNNIATTYIDCANDKTAAGVFAPWSSNTISRWSKSVTFPAGTATVNLYLFHNYAQAFGSSGGGKVIDYYRASLRPGSAASAAVANLQASVTTNTGAIASIENTAAFYETIVAASGSNKAVVRMVAGKYGSAVDIGADVVYLGANRTFAVTNGKATVAGDLYIQGGNLIIQGSTHMLVQGLGFGATNEFVEWYGPIMAVSACSRANGLSWKTLTGAQKISAFQIGLLVSGQTNASLAANVTTSTGSFGSNGGAIQGTASWYYQDVDTSTYSADSSGLADFEAYMTSMGATHQGAGHWYGSGTVSTGGTSSLSLKKNGSTVATVTGTTMTRTVDGYAPVPGDSTGSATVTHVATLSLTYNDPTLSTASREYSAELTRYVGMASPQQQTVTVGSSE